MFICKGCGANINFDAISQMMRCPYCDTEISPEDEVEVKYAVESEDIVTKTIEESETTTEIFTEESSGKEKELLISEDMEVTIFTCSQCGAELLSDDTTAVTFCSYCGSSTPLSSHLTKTKKPSFVIPFKHGIAYAKEQYKRHVQGNFFAPNNLKSEAVIEKIRGIYMPYYVYDAKLEKDIATTTYTKKVGTAYTETTYYDSTFHLSLDYDGIVFDGLSNFSDEISNEILPFKNEDKREFEINYLSGFYADTTDVESDVYDEKVRKILKSVVNKDNIERQIRDYQLEKEIKVADRDISIDKPKILFAPVYFLANRYGDRVCYGVVNGQTGKVYADIPISISKYFVCSLILSAFLFVGLSIFQLNPVMMLWVCLMLDIGFYFTLDYAANAVYYHENAVDDLGVRSKLKEYERARAKWLSELDLKESKAPKIVGISILSFALMILAVLAIVYSGRFGQMISPFAFAVLFGSNAFRKSMIAKITQEPDSPKAPFSEKLNYVIKPIISMAIAAIVLLINPVHDMFYYFAAMGIFVLMVWSIYDLITAENILSSRKLPQLNKRGGDERETIM